jgi:hypothetical protein
MMGGLVAIVEQDFQRPKSRSGLEESEKSFHYSVEDKDEIDTSNLSPSQVKEHSGT